MPGIFKKITKGSFVIANLAVSLLMCILYLLPYLQPSTLAFFNLFPLAFPYLLILQFIFLFFWLFVQKKYMLIPAITILICGKLILSLVGVHFFEDKKSVNKKNLRFASWNVQLFGFFNNNGSLDTSMLSYVKSLKSDIFCAQELVFSLSDTSSFSLEHLKKQLGYKYVFAGNDRAFGVHANNHQNNGKEYYPFCLAIFSNYPIIKTKKIQPIPEYNHTFIWADVQVGSDTLRIFNIHLQSMHFVKKDYDFIETIDQQNASSISSRGKTLFRKLREANFQRAIQVLAVQEELKKSPHPVILCGDMNDVPNSYAYQILRSDLRDAFADKGYGIGRTFQFLAPTLRVDYIFYHDRLPLKTIQVNKGKLSDHKPLIATFDLPAATE
jgi:endonuclease/exonuclease/phosphatase family metal-dependent hydrolase